MDQVLLKVLLWTVSVVRSAIITACVSALYCAVYVACFEGNFSDTEEVLLPSISAALLFLGLILSDTAWVESHFNEPKKRKL